MLGTWVKLLLFLQMITEFVNVCPFLFIPQEFVTIWTRGKKILHNHPPFFFLAQIESNPCGTKNPAPFKWCKCTRLYRGKPWVYEPSIEASTFCTCIRKCCSTNEQNIHGFFLTCMNRRPVQFLKIRISKLCYAAIVTLSNEISFHFIFKLRTVKISLKQYLCRGFLINSSFHYAM